MSKIYQGIGFAIGLIAGLGIALLFLVWAVPEFRNPTVAYEYYQHWQAKSTSSPYQNTDDTHQWIREFSGWVFAEDSLAQWLMAGLGFAATVISLLALIWIKRTWVQAKRSADAANDVVSVTREIGQKQVRAYLSIERVDFTWNGTGSESNISNIIFVWKNFGNSPAFDANILTNVELVTNEKFGDAIDEFVTDIEDADFGHFEISPGGSVYHEGIEIGVDETQRWIGGEISLVSQSIAIYKDVFGNRRHTEITQSAHHFPAEGKGNTGYVRFKNYAHHNSAS